ncbi:hypothetical protein PRIPAC_90853 [Pristionchus pacificus]|nr:hypothetical protein PRIPAC_90853 [Pristionchus pacificus]
MMQRVLLTGAVGCGKGTIAKKVVEHFEGFAYFCAGDVIRQHISNGSEFGKRASSFLKAGEHVPENLVNEVLLQEVQRLRDSHLVLDGFPRTIAQVTAVEASLPVSLCIELDVPRKVIEERLSKRLVHIPSGRTYNLDYNPPRVPGKDDVTGEPLERRVDDTDEAIRRRMEVYKKTESKVAAAYREAGLGLTIKGDSSDKIWPVVRAQIEDLLEQKRQAKSG